jgi:PAS domain S-box-containing protein
MRILVADDDLTTLTMLTAVLEKWGYELVVAKNGSEAWEELQKIDAPRLVLLDWIMPGMDGVEVVRRVRAQDIPLQPYIIMLTSRTDDDDIVKGLEAGANDYLPKPYGQGKLRARMEVGTRMIGLQSALVEKVRELQTAMNEVRTLRGFIPICAYCRKIRDDKGFWQQVESYVHTHTLARFTHGCCPECAAKLSQESEENGEGATAQANKTPSQLRVLIVGEDKHLSDDIPKGFESHGYKVDTTVEAGAASEAFSMYAYDIALLDESLPGGDGGALLAVFSAQRPDCICVMITAGSGSVVDWKKQGAAACLPRPLNVECLIETCARIRAERSLALSEELHEAGKRELERSEARFKTLYEDAPVLINGFDRNRRCILWNKECEKVFGWTIDELNSHEEPLALIYRDPAALKKATESVATNQDRTLKEWHPSTRDGRELTVMLAAFRLPGSVAVNIGCDITGYCERKNEAEK